MSSTTSSSAAALTNSTSKIVVDAFSDVACPWCWVGKRSIEKAAENLNKRGIQFQLELHWHPFQLNPDIRSGETENVVEHLSHIIGSRAMIQQWVANPGLIPMNQRCSAEGFSNIQFALRENGVVYNTYKAHKLLTYVGEIKKDYAKQNALKEIMLRMTHWEGKNLDLNSELTKACVEANVASTEREVESICNDAAVTKCVDSELRKVTQLRNFSGVPYFIFPNKQVISGAESVANFERALQKCMS